MLFWALSCRVLGPQTMTIEVCSKNAAQSWVHLEDCRRGLIAGASKVWGLDLGGKPVAEKMCFLPSTRVWRKF